MVVICHAKKVVINGHNIMLIVSPACAHSHTIISVLHMYSLLLVYRTCRHGVGTNSKYPHCLRCGCGINVCRSSQQLSQIVDNMVRKC